MLTPQQKEWTIKEMINVLGLPNEIISLICDFKDHPIEFRTELLNNGGNFHSFKSFLFNNIGEIRL
jgi:hypothetical protein